MPSAFGERTGFDMDESHIFPQGVLAAITLVVGESIDGGARAVTECEVGLRLCSVAITTLSGAGSIPSCLSRNLEGHPELALFPLSESLSLSPHWDLCLRGGEC